jgi:hypothetical protein
VDEREVPQVRGTVATARVTAAAALAALLALPAGAQQAFRCTGADGKVTYQQSPCPTSAGQQKVDITPANPDYDPSARERLLKQEADLDKRLEARAAREAAERREREAREEKERERERETAQREAAREAPQYIYAWPPGGQRPPPYPWPRPPPPKPGPAPKPR